MRLEWKIIHILKARVFLLLLCWGSVSYIIPGSRRENTWKLSFNYKISKCRWLITLFWSPCNFWIPCSALEITKRYITEELKFMKECILNKALYSYQLLHVCKWINTNYLLCIRYCFRYMKYSWVTAMK